MKFFQYGSQAINLDGIRYMEVGSYQGYHVSIYYSSINRNDKEILGTFKKREDAERLLAEIVAALNGTTNEEKNSKENSKNPLTNA